MGEGCRLQDTCTLFCPYPCIVPMVPVLHSFGCPQWSEPFLSAQQLEESLLSNSWSPSGKGANPRYHPYYSPSPCLLPVANVYLSLSLDCSLQMMILNGCGMTAVPMRLAIGCWVGGHFVDSRTQL